MCMLLLWHRWHRGGGDVCYFKNHISVGDSDRCHYTLSWTFTAAASNDTVYFAHCYPYTYSVTLLPRAGAWASVCVCGMFAFDSMGTHTAIVCVCVSLSLCLSLSSLSLSVCACVWLPRLYLTGDGAWVVAGSASVPHVTAHR